MKTGNKLVCIKLQVRKLSIAKYSDYYNNLHNVICKNNDLFIVLKLEI